MSRSKVVRSSGVSSLTWDLPHARLPVDQAAERLTRWFGATVELMQVLSRACGRSHLSELTPDDLTTFDRDMAHLTGVRYGGVIA